MSISFPRRWHHLTAKGQQKDSRLVLPTAYPPAHLKILGPDAPAPLPPHAQASLRPGWDRNALTVKLLPGFPETLRLRGHSSHKEPLFSERVWLRSYTYFRFPGCISVGSEAASWVQTTGSPERFFYLVFSGCLVQAKLSLFLAPLTLTPPLQSAFA